MNTSFTPPVGCRIDNPPMEAIRDLVLQGDEQYWCAGSGDGSFELKFNDRTVMLSLVLKEPYGFLLQYGLYDSTDDYVARTTADSTTVVKTYLGGDARFVPNAFFIDRHKTWEAVEEFCSSGERCSSLTWVRLDEQQWSAQPFSLS